MKIDTENSAPWLNLNKFEFSFKLQMQASNRHLIDKIGQARHEFRPERVHHQHESKHDRVCVPRFEGEGGKMMENVLKVTE